MFAFECLSESLGILFEPYVIRILPVLLKVSYASRQSLRGCPGRVAVYGAVTPCVPTARAGRT